MKTRLGITFRIYVLLTLILGVAYPMLVTGLGQVFFTDHANGGLIARGGRLVALKGLAQGFKAPGHFWGRPSANEYDALNSGGSNFGPTAQALVDKMSARAVVLGEDGPLELRQASASGLDPHLSPGAALAQVERVAAARKVDAARVRELVEQHVKPRAFGFLGEPVVNVVELNLALDELSH